MAILNVKNQQEHKDNRLINFLFEGERKELVEILAFWEKYKQEGELLEKNFRKERGDLDDISNISVQNYRNLLVQYSENEKKFMAELDKKEKELLNKLNPTLKEKFISEYLYKRILYSWSYEKKPEDVSLNENKTEKFLFTRNPRLRAKLVKRKFKKWMSIYLDNIYDDKTLLKITNELKGALKPHMSIHLPQNRLWYEPIKQIAESWKSFLTEWLLIDLTSNRIWNDWLAALAKERKKSLQQGMMLRFSANNIWDEWLKHLATEWRNSLKPWMVMYFDRNRISDEWLKAIAHNRKNWLKSWLYFDFAYNNIWDTWAKALANEWGDKLETWMKILLVGNKIWDDWADELMKLKLKDWVSIDFSCNLISDDKIEELKKRVQSYKDRWINCQLFV